jgi:O-antigen ligase
MDPWLDAVFPIATALICTRQRLIANGLLTLFVLLRLLQGSNKEGWRWILVLLVLMNAGLVIEDRDLKPGSTSDYLIIAAAFAAGFQRTVAQWRRSLPWLASCIAPLLAFSLAAGSNLTQGNSSFTGFNINKLGFLSGLLMVTGYTYFLQSQNHRERLASLLLTSLGAWEAVLTQSRAAIAAPIIAAIIDAASRVQWNPRKLLGATIASLASIAIVAHQWYFNPSEADSSSYHNRLSDFNRIETIHCWISSTAQNPNSFFLGLGYGNAARDQCGREAIPTLKDVAKAKGLQHAHNLFAQLFAETGIGGLIFIIGLTLTGFRQAWHLSHSKTLPFCFPLLIYLFLMALGITYWQVLMLNQILVGYSLASLSAVELDDVSEDGPTPITPAI